MAICRRARGDITGSIPENGIPDRLQNGRWGTVVYFRILGPLEVDDGVRSVPLRGTKPRVLLCALLTAPNDVVSTDSLVDWLWSRRPPPTASAIVQALVSRLRRALEPDRPPWTEARVLLRRPPGYLLRVAPDEVDAMRFERMAAHGHTALERGDSATAARVLGDALSLWRGRALADVALVEAAQMSIARLEGLRLSATVMRIDADLALGRHVALVPELESLVHSYPLDERLCSQLMVALYRCGRQADSLNVYERIRATLAEELNIEPSPASQRLREAILAQDPALDDGGLPAGRLA
jgi:DNA-binding SARP family transcriptional activator